ncbi:hypothetical protein QAD02_011045 [Eretmocerus hayati]|uniref:Uncharacterized protein n=1 Tax=Eretmocerus hayati TaxID=131215 RepID=A0ACC2NY91_9HYME|nr:hypothetical protein QAD02_011045 [Eretmocerus hayati]
MNRRMTTGYLEQPRHTCTWEINRPDMQIYCRSINDAVESQKFKLRGPDGNELEWLLRVYLVSKKNEEKLIAGMSVQLVSLNHDKIWVKFRLSITTTLVNGEALFTYKYISEPEGKLFSYLGCEKGTRLNDACLRLWLNSRSCQDQRRLLIQFDLDNIQYDTDRNQIIENKVGNQSQLIQDKCALNSFANYCDNCCTFGTHRKIGTVRGSHVDQEVEDCDDECASNEGDRSLKFIQDKKFGDVSIEVNGKIFRAHRVLLRSQSEAFAKILGDSENDEDEKTISIDDVDHKVFTEILRFIYYKEVKGIQEYAKNLLAAALKYSMEPLKRICEEEVSKSVTCENAIEYLQMADQSELGELKKVVVEFVASNLKEISRSSSFAYLENMKSSLLFELIQAMGNKM